jgi:F-type H+-transporting ATPase subunit b
MELLTPGQGLVFWMVLVFLMLLLILKRFAWGPILKAIRQREDKIEHALHLAEITRSEMAQLQYDNKVLHEKATQERDAILLDARNIKESIIEEARMKAAEEAERIIASAKESIHYEKMAAITDLKNEVAKLSVEIAEKVLAEELSAPGKHEQLIQREIANLAF